jgi:hypothetical protein
MNDRTDSFADPQAVARYADGPSRLVRGFVHLQRIACRARVSWLVSLLGGAVLLGQSAFAAQEPSVQTASSNVPGGCEVHVSKRTAENGCYLLATEPLARLPTGQVFWHLYTYPTRAAAEAARQGSASTVVESLGKIWLFAIEGSSWRAAGGDLVAKIGPLSVAPAQRYTARYFEAVFPPQQAMRTGVHNHSGPEAWYVVTGAQCLRTPEGVVVLRAGESGFVRAGLSMMLTSIGSEVRSAVALVLHDASQPWVTSTTDWTPNSQCPEE